MALDIFTFSNYRAFLAAFFAEPENAGQSFRAWAKKCEISSPNYLQQVVAKQRNLTMKTAVKVAAGLELPPLERAYFLGLIRLEHDPAVDREAVMEDLRRCVKKAKRQDVRDDAIHSNWLHPIIFELAITNDFKLTVPNLQTRLGHFASRTEIEESVTFLTKKKWLLPTDEPDVYKQNAIQFEVLNDIRRIDIQRSHLRFLELAKHRINADLADREYQGLTMALPLAKLELIRDRMRKFMDDLHDELDGAEPGDTIVRVQMCAFKVTNDP